MTPKIGNTLGSSYGGFVGESSFKLVKDAPISDFEGIVYKNPYDFVKFSKPSVDPYCFTGHKSIPPIKVILIDVPKI